MIAIIMHPDDYDQIFIPLVIGVMKTFTEFFLEMMCIALVSKSDQVHNAIMDFIALSVISNLDERYFDSIIDPLKDKMIREEFKIPIKIGRKQDSDFEKNSKIKKCNLCWVALKVSNFVYELFYFYMMPYLVYFFLILQILIQNYHQ